MHALDLGRLGGQDIGIYCCEREGMLSRCIAWCMSLSLSGMVLVVFKEKIELKACIHKTPRFVELFDACAILRPATRRTHDISGQRSCLLAWLTELWSRACRRRNGQPRPLLMSELRTHRSSVSSFFSSFFFFSRSFFPFFFRFFSLSVPLDFLDIRVFLTMKPI